jgi:hypothetical protein
VSEENKPRTGPPNPPPPPPPRPQPKKTSITLRPREAVMNSRKAEIVRAMRDASEADQVIPLEWVQELAELVDVDLRKR